MSSHHFVTESQAAALFISGKNIGQRILYQLLEWNPVVIAAVEQVDWLSSLNIGIDCLVMPSSLDIPALPYEAEIWNEADLVEHLLRTFRKGQAGRLAIAGAADIDVGRILKQWQDHKSYPVTVYSGRCKFFRVGSGDTFKKWVCANFCFDVLDPADAVIVGKIVRKDGIYRTLAAGWIEIAASKDVVFREYFEES